MKQVVLWMVLAIAICVALYALNQRTLVEWAIVECGGVERLRCIVDMSMLPPFG